ncbi:LANO_0E12552g1_1 [Lachancea nothofagi CBS 11611]|uniref:LANO_0E12552g1_1 n=1 Tax=Lachancea nothofagi CBS 11611 TaxID=1266666 RepID=A0A1G4JYJ1_9SACH|nr:LANO_0E12552g1_1 [Lachancea nothofagi CBS 11611]
MSISLEHVLGFKVRVTNNLDAVTLGRIYSYNSSNNTITLQESKKPNQSHQFKIIKLSFVKNLEVVGEKPLKNSFRRDPIRPSAVSITGVQETLRKRVEEAREANK